MKNKKLWIGIACALCALLLVGAMILAYVIFSEKPVEGEKSISITVTNSKGESTVYELRTDAEYLIDAMRECEEQGLTFGGYDSQYGFTVTTVCGEVADFNVDSSYWSFYVNGTYCNYGISEQPVADGDAFEIKYEKM